jgi:hypothetical protein
LNIAVAVVAAAAAVWYSTDGGSTSNSNIFTHQNLEAKLEIQKCQVSKCNPLSTKPSFLFSVIRIHFAAKTPLDYNPWPYPLITQNSETIHVPPCATECFIP